MSGLPTFIIAATLFLWLAILAIVAARGGFIWRAVWEEEYREGTVASFLGCCPSNISRGLRKQGARLRESRHV